MATQRTERKGKAVRGVSSNFTAFIYFIVSLVSLLCARLTTASSRSRRLALAAAPSYHQGTSGHRGHHKLTVPHSHCPPHSWSRQMGKASMAHYGPKQRRPTHPQELLLT